MNKETVIHGKFNFGKRVLTDIIQGENGFMMIGHTPMDFGFFHPWEVGPYPTIKKALEDFNQGNKDLK